MSSFGNLIGMRSRLSGWIFTRTSQTKADYNIQKGITLHFVLCQGRRVIAPTPQTRADYNVQNGVTFCAVPHPLNMVVGSISYYPLINGIQTPEQASTPSPNE